MKSNNWDFFKISIISLCSTFYQFLFYLKPVFQDFDRHVFLFVNSNVFSVCLGMGPGAIR